MSELGHHRLVQAPVPAIDADGLGVVALGTALFAVASIGCMIGSDWLTRTGHQDWTAISISGFGLGLIGLFYCWNRRRRQRSGAGRRFDSDLGRVQSGDYGL